MVEAIIFDFDDTLVVSEKIKQQGYVFVFPDFTDHHEWIHAYTSSQQGAPRRDIIKGILEYLSSNFDIISAGEEDVRIYTQAYTDYIDEQVIHAKSTPLVESTLKTLSTLVPLHVNSNTPSASLTYIINKRGWSDYFRSVHGSPPHTKLKNMSVIIDQNGYQPERVVVVGDGDSDREAAIQHGAQFVRFGNSDRPDEVVISRINQLLQKLSIV